VLAGDMETKKFLPSDNSSDNFHAMKTVEVKDGRSRSKKKRGETEVLDGGEDDIFSEQSV